MDNKLFSEESNEQEFVSVADVGEIEDGCGKAFTIGQRIVAVFLRDGQYFAVDDFCPHQGASLSEGYLQGCAVACPWHHWQFSLEDGTWIDNPKISIDTFEVRVMGGKIQVAKPPS